MTVWRSSVLSSIQKCQMSFTMSWPTRDVPTRLSVRWKEWISSENRRQLDNWLKPSKVDHMDCGEHGICFHLLFAPEGNSNIPIYELHQFTTRRHQKHFSFFVFSAFCTFQRSDSHVGKVISRLFNFIRNRLSARVYLLWVALSAVARITPDTFRMHAAHTQQTFFPHTRTSMLHAEETMNNSNNNEEKKKMDFDAVNNIKLEIIYPNKSKNFSVAKFYHSSFTCIWIWCDAIHRFQSVEL